MQMFNTTRVILEKGVLISRLNISSSLAELLLEFNITLSEHSYIFSDNPFSMDKLKATTVISPVRTR